MLFTNFALGNAYLRSKVQPRIRDIKFYEIIPTKYLKVYLLGSFVMKIWINDRIGSEADFNKDHVLSPHRSCDDHILNLHALKGHFMSRRGIANPIINFLEAIPQLILP